MHSQPLLASEALTKRFHNFEVLKGVDLDVHQGEVVSIIGSSGSGKTTLLRCVNLLEEFEGGEILLDGESDRLSPGRAAPPAAEGPRTLPSARDDRHGVSGVQPVSASDRAGERHAGPHAR